MIAILFGAIVGARGKFGGPGHGGGVIVPGKGVDLHRAKEAFFQMGDVLEPGLVGDHRRTMVTLEIAELGQAIADILEQRTEGHPAQVVDDDDQADQGLILLGGLDGVDDMLQLTCRYPS